MYAYDATTVGNSSIAAGTFYSAASANSIALTVTSGVSAALEQRPDRVVVPTRLRRHLYGAERRAGREVHHRRQQHQGDWPGQFQPVCHPGEPHADGNGATLVADYAVDAPGGTWTAASAGSYTITLEPNQVGDTSGDYAPTAVLATYNVVAITPIA